MKNQHDNEEEFGGYLGIDYKNIQTQSEFQ